MMMRFVCFSFLRQHCESHQMPQNKNMKKNNSFNHGVNECRWEVYNLFTSVSGNVKNACIDDFMCNKHPTTNIKIYA